jgi:uncharacterized cupredoxin-like copper-binding protein
MKKFFLLFLTSVVIWLTLTACGGSDSGKPVSSLSVEMSEFKFSPASMTVFAGQPISLKLTNSGAVEHEFTILKKGSVATIPFDSEKQAADILAKFKLGANQNETYQFVLPEAGEYSVICAIQGHMEAGMVAKLTAVNP